MSFYYAVERDGDHVRVAHNDIHDAQFLRGVYG